MKLKDIVTFGNLLSGFASVIALFHNSFEWACYLIFISYIFDVMDGPVARLTKQSDTFGAIFDSICDFVSYSIAPSFIIYFAYWKIAGFPWIVAALIGAFPISLGTIRQAKQQDEQKSYPCYWLGVPRPVLSMFILALLNSSLFNFTGDTMRTVGFTIVAVLIISFSFLHLSHLPFVNHHKRRWMRLLWFGKWFFLGGSSVVAIIEGILFQELRFFYDYMTFCMVVYIFISWTQITREDFRRIKNYLKGEPLVKPLVHVDNSWKTKTLFPYFWEKDAK